MYCRGPDSEFLKKILRLASMQERMDLPAKAQEENDLLEVRKHHTILRSLFLESHDSYFTSHLSYITWKRRTNDWTHLNTCVGVSRACKRDVQPPHVTRRRRIPIWQTQIDPLLLRISVSWPPMTNPLLDRFSNLSPDEILTFKKRNTDASISGSLCVIYLQFIKQGSGWSKQRLITPSDRARLLRGH